MCHASAGEEDGEERGDREGEEKELNEDQKAALYSVPDRKGQKAKSEGVSMYMCTCTYVFYWYTCVRIIRLLLVLGNLFNVPFSLHVSACLKSQWLIIFLFVIDG